MIIAIGGGEVTERETLEIDKFIVLSAKKEHPHLLFIPTASHDAKPYIDAITGLFSDLGCSVDSLCLCDGKSSPHEIKQKIDQSDIIYVGGGNTEYMMDVWRKYGVDTCLKEAYLADKVLSGLSAGSICWFIAGHSDSEFISEVDNPKHKWIKGLGFIPFLHCPHYDEDSRSNFDDFYRGQITDAIAIENQVAVVWKNQELSIIKAVEDKHAYRLAYSSDGLIKEVLT